MFQWKQSVSFQWNGMQCLWHTLDGATLSCCDLLLISTETQFFFLLSCIDCTKIYFLILIFYLFVTQWTLKPWSLHWQCWVEPSSSASPSVAAAAAASRVLQGKVLRQDVGQVKTHQSRLSVIDGPVGELLWLSLSFQYKLTEEIPETSCFNL